EYIEMWLTDAGLATSPDWRVRYDEWLDYFSALGITGIGMGWITVTRAEREQPDVHLESWPYAVEQPVSAALGARASALTLASLSDADLLTRRLVVPDDVTQETLGRPGAVDPEHIVLRSASGLRRAMEVDTALGGVLGACDGDLTLGQIMAGVAGVLDVDNATVVEATLPGVRRAIRDALLLDTAPPARHGRGGAL
ncbi:MAG TPA: transferase, partial [Propionibacteriaceae bacterium]|nr:transferase [Propionibacteriaceae bacterium]